MNEVLSIDEINRRFASQWVLIGDPETDESLEVLSGKVLWHSNDREQVYRKAAELKPKQAAFHFAGPLFDDETEYCLNWRLWP